MNWMVSRLRLGNGSTTQQPFLAWSRMRAREVEPERAAASKKKGRLVI